MHTHALEFGEEGRGSVSASSGDPLVGGEGGELDSQIHALPIDGMRRGGRPARSVGLFDRYVFLGMCAVPSGMLVVHSYSIIAPVCKPVAMR